MENDMIRIPLHSKKYPGLFALISDKRFPLVSQYRWNPQWNPKSKTFYATGFISGSKTRIKMHRLILNAQPGELSDHKDHNGLNNQDFNIRICNHSQNSANRIKHRGISEHKGVSWNKQRKKWQAVIRLNKKLIHLGCFDNEITAAEIYNQKAIELFGEFALLNNMTKF